MGGPSTVGPPDERPSVGTANARPFIGRDQELGQLIAALEAARSGRGSLILVSGEPGIGKSRLMEEFADTARDRGCLVLIGRCWEGGGAPAYWPWVQVVRAAGGNFEELASRDEPGRAGPSSVADIVDPAAARFELFEHVADFLSEQSRAEPVLVVVDDLHAADEPSMVLLRFLATSVADQRMLVVASYRDVEPRIREAAELFGELSRLGRRLPLAGLTRPEIARYIAIVTDSAPTPMLVERVHELTAGNPFFVGEVVRVQAEQRLEGDRYRLPEEVRALIRRRVSDLSPETGNILRAASVLGREFELHVLAGMSTLSTERLIDVLGEAELAGIIAADPRVPGSYAFAHDLLCEAMYEDLPATRRMELHRIAAHVLEQVFAADLGPRLAAIAHHFTQSAPLGDAEAAVEYTTRAGDEAVRLLAYEDAARQYERSLQLLPPGEASLGRRCEILLRLGSALSRSADTEGGKHSFKEAAEIATRLGDAEALARAAIAYVAGADPVRLGFGGLLLTSLFDETSTGIALLEDALSQLPDGDNTLRARVLARLATALYTTPQSERRLRLSQEATGMALRLGDPQALVEALYAHHWATLGPDSVSDRLENAQQMLLVATGAGEREAAFLAHHVRLHCFFELFNAAGFDAELAAMQQLAGAIRQPFYTWHVACLQAVRALLDGRPSQAERIVRDAYETGRVRTNEDVTYLYEYAQIHAIRWTQGRLDEVQQRVRQHGVKYPVIARWRDALLAAEIEDHASARAEIERHARNQFRDLPRNGLWLLHLCALAQACVLIRDLPRADALYELLLPFADRNAIAISTVPFGPVAMRLGMLAGLLERWDEADAHFETAFELCQRFGAPALRARVLLEYGKVLLGRGREGDGQRAAELLSASDALSHELELTGIATRVSDVRDGAEPPPAAAPTSEAVFRREGQIWTITYDGRTARLHDLRGFRYIADLLGSPGREFHAMELLTAHTSTAGLDSTGHGFDGVTSTPSEPVLDARAKQEYRRRLQDLSEELDEARSWHDPERVAALEAEVDAITDELRRAVGLGGRDREMLSPSERARVSVTKAIKAAVRAISKECPPLGEHLGASIRTGGFCSYAPPGQQPPKWVL